MGAATTQDGLNPNSNRPTPAVSHEKGMNCRRRLALTADPQTQWGNCRDNQPPSKNQRRQYDASDNPGEQQQPPPPQLPQMVGRDERGWLMIDVPPNVPGRHMMYKLKVGGKLLTLCPQEAHVMRVELNPDPDITAFDEWQTHP